MKEMEECRCQWRLGNCGEPPLEPLPLPPPPPLLPLPPPGTALPTAQLVPIELLVTLTELVRPNSEFREFWRCGITNLGGACGVYCGGIELDDACRTNIRCPIISADDTGWGDDDDVGCTELARVGGGTLARGGIAGGGPLAVTEFCDWTRGGNCGSLPLGCSVVALIGVDVLDVVLVVDWMGRVMGLVIGDDAVVEGRTGCWLCGWTVDVLVKGFCGWIVCLMVTVVGVFCWEGRCWVCFCGWGGCGWVCWTGCFGCWICCGVGCWCCRWCCCLPGDLGDGWAGFFFCSWPAATYENTQSTE